MKKLISYIFCISLVLSTSTGCVSNSKNEVSNNVESIVESELILDSDIEKEVVTESESLITVKEETEVQITTGAAEIVQEDKMKLSEVITHYSQDSLPEFIRQIEWTEDMVVNSDDELRAYIANNIDELQIKIPVILSDECGDLKETTIMEISSDTVVASHGQQAELSYNNLKCTYAVYELGYFTSAYILNAYKNDDTSRLSSDNLAVYNKAVNFIENELDKVSSDLEKEKQIHDYICSMVTYYTDENESNQYLPENIPRYRLALGAMLDGSANCMGYTDTFYMLCNMAGIETGKVSSDESMNHTWNVVTLNNKKYVTDVTWDDDAMAMSDGTMLNEYIYFNAGLDVINQEYRYDANNELMKSVVQISDENYFYGINSSNFGYITGTYDEFYNKSKELIESGQTTFYIACRNIVAGDTNDMINKIFDKLGNTGGRCSGLLKNIGGYSFAYIQYSAN